MTHRPGKSLIRFMENQLGIPLENLGRADSYKIDYSAVAEKSRCVTGMVNIACIINTLCWSGRRDSNPRPSAPKSSAKLSTQGVVSFQMERRGQIKTHLAIQSKLEVGA